MTYFYAQLFAMDAEIRAMFPAAMDVQRRRFFEALSRIADAQQSQEAATASCLTCRNSGARTVNSAFASGTTRCSGAP